MVEIKIDVDNRKIDWLRIRNVLEFFSGNAGYGECKLKFIKGKVMSKNSTHHHIIIDVESIRTDDVPFLQILFGSDWKREMLNFARLFSKRDFHEQNCLFEENYKTNYKATQKLNDIIAKINKG